MAMLKNPSSCPPSKVMDIISVLNRPHEVSCKSVELASNPLQQSCVVQIYTSILVFVQSFKFDSYSRNKYRKSSLWLRPTSETGNRLFCCVNFKEENRMKIENEFAIIEQTPGSITITWKHPNTEKSKVKAHDIATLDNAGLFIKPSDQISDAKLVIDGKPLAEVINSLRAAITNIGGQLAALQTSETANHAAKIASRAASSGYDHDKHK